MTDSERIEVLEGKIAFLMALTKVQGQRLHWLENVPPTPPPPPLTDFGEYAPNRGSEIA